MLRTALLTATAALGLALPATAEAHPPGYYPPAPGYPAYYPPCRTWQVLYRTCAREPWRVYAAYPSDYAARHAAHGLRVSGYNVRVTING